MTWDGSFLNAYASTLQPLLIGFTICGIIGVGFGIWMGLSRAMEWFSLPVFVILQAAPMAAVIPLITYTYGIGLGECRRFMGERIEARSRRVRVLEALLGLAVVMGILLVQLKRTYPLQRSEAVYGQPLDVLPGLYGPQQFLSWLQ